jgi:NAD(P)-dependent dehydrogenase (short-subunit alcohol dehydrogenase family)
VHQLEGKVAVVTGGGSGIGAGVARACAAAGMSVAVVDVDLGRASSIADDLLAAGAHAAPYAVDVADASAVAGLAAEVFERFGGCHLLHNNAGLCPLGRSWDHDAVEWHHVLGVNLLGAVNGVNAFVPRMIEQGGEAHVVNTASAAALRFVPSSAMYNTSKIAVVGYTESLRHDLAPHGIGASVVCPGGVATNIGESMRGAAGRQRSDEELASLLADLRTLAMSHTTVITADDVGVVVLEGVRNNDLYIITHPGSEPQVVARHRAIEHAYQVQRERHPELP